MSEINIVDQNKIIVSADGDQLKKIEEVLGENPEKLQNHVKLFLDWLRCANHLPSNVDQQLIENYIRLCKYDLEKAKNKFEAYVALRTKFTHFFNNRKLSPDFFDPIRVHRNVLVMPKLTEDGYRVMCYRLDSPDTKAVDYEKTLKYGSMLLDFLLYKDVNAGIINIYDFKDFNMQHLGKLNLTMFKCFVEILYKIGPFRLKGLHLLNASPAAEVLVNVSLVFMSSKLRDRFVIHRTRESLTDYISPDVLVEEYNGTYGSLAEASDKFRDYFLSQNEWLEKTERLKLTGPVPKSKEALFSFEEYSMTGSFRQLAID